MCCVSMMIKDTSVVQIIYVSQIIKLDVVRIMVSAKLDVGRISVEVGPAAGGAGFLRLCGAFVL